MCIFGGIHKASFDNDLKSVLLELRNLNYGRQTGLPFGLGSPTSTSLGPDAVFTVRLPEEDGGVWLDDFGAPALWSVNTVRTWDKVLKAYKNRANIDKCFTPAVFCVAAASDDGQVPGHRKILEKMFLGISVACKREHERKKRTMEGLKPVGESQHQGPERGGDTEGDDSSDEDARQKAGVAVEDDSDEDAAGVRLECLYEKLKGFACVFAGQPADKVQVPTFPTNSNLL